MQETHLALGGGGGVSRGCHACDAGVPLRQLHISQSPSFLFKALPIELVPRSNTPQNLSRSLLWEGTTQYVYLDCAILYFEGYDHQNTSIMLSAKGPS